MIITYHPLEEMDGLLVLKEETVATSLAGLVCDPSTFIVEEYSEEVGRPSVKRPSRLFQVGDFKDAEGMNIAQEVFIDNEPNTITYEVRAVWILDNPDDRRCVRWMARTACSPPAVPGVPRSSCCTVSTGCQRRRGERKHGTSSITNTDFQGV